MRIKIDIKELKRTLDRAVDAANEAASYAEAAMGDLDDLDENEGLTPGVAILVAANLLTTYHDLPDQVREYLSCIRDNKPLAEHVPGFALLAV